MSDVGVYAAVQAEIVALLTTPAITVSSVTANIRSALSVAHLVEGPEAVQKPMVGVILLDSRALGEDEQTLSRQIRVETFWQIAAVDASNRGASDRRTWCYSVLETVRDRLHQYTSTIAPGYDVYRWVSESFTAETPSVMAAVATYRLPLMLGR
jgi:hypothetical protein